MQIQDLEQLAGFSSLPRQTKQLLVNLGAAVERDAQRLQALKALLIDRLGEAPFSDTDFLSVDMLQRLLFEHAVVSLKVGDVLIEDLTPLII